MSLTFIEPNAPVEWLANSPTTIDAIRKELVDSDLPQSLVEGMTETLNEVQHLLGLNDELFKFSSPPETWQNMMGTSGLAIVRNGQIVRSIMLAMN